MGWVLMSEREVHRVEVLSGVVAAFHSGERDHHQASEDRERSSCAVVQGEGDVRTVEGPGSIVLSQSVAF